MESLGEVPQNVIIKIPSNLFFMIKFKLATRKVIQDKYHRFL